MSLLSNLTLAYELPADDPIEMGIHYGRSILDVLASNVHNAVDTIESDFHTALAAATPRNVVRSRPTHPATYVHVAAAATSRNAANYSPRPTSVATSRFRTDFRRTSQPAFQKRTLIGAL